MQTGTLVQYTQRENEPPFPAVVMREWPDHSVELAVWRFDSTEHIRSVDRSQFTVLLDPLQILSLEIQNAAFGQQLTAVQKQLELVQEQLRRMRSETPYAPEPPSDAEPPEPPPIEPEPPPIEPAPDPIPEPPREPQFDPDESTVDQDDQAVFAGVDSTPSPRWRKPARR
jgi:hypothetical protein